MADAFARPISCNHIPLVTDVRMRAFVGRSNDVLSGITLTYLDHAGRTVGSSLCDLDDAEQHGRDLLAAVAAARATDPKVVPITLMPRSHSPLMRDVRTGGAA